MKCPLLINNIRSLLNVTRKLTLIEKGYIDFKDIFSYCGKYYITTSI